jgi:hypothetical protein
MQINILDKDWNLREIEHVRMTSTYPNLSEGGSDPVLIIYYESGTTEYIPLKDIRCITTHP